MTYLRQDSILFVLYITRKHINELRLRAAPIYRVWSYGTVHGSDPDEALNLFQACLQPRILFFISYPFSRTFIIQTT